MASHNSSQAVGHHSANSSPGPLLQHALRYDDRVSFVSGLEYRSTNGHTAKWVDPATAVPVLP